MENSWLRRSLRLRKVMEINTKRYKKKKSEKLCAGAVSPFLGEKKKKEGKGAPTIKEAVLMGCTRATVRSYLPRNDRSYS